MKTKTQLHISGKIVVILFLFVSGVYAEKAPSASVYGMIAFVSGEASITKNNKTTSAKLNMKVEESDVVTTKNGLVRIQLADAYICLIEKNTSVTFKKILEDTNYKSYNVDLHKGQVYSKLIPDKSKPGQLTIFSPSVTAGVRGTEFMVSETGEKPAAVKNTGDGKIIPSGVYVSNGSVDVEINGGENNQKINVKSGEQATVSPGKLIKDILDDYVATKLKILEELKIMKEYNCKLIEEQKEKNRKMLEEFK
jgi:hypothetical protein